ncbi:protein SpAN-like isoform X2 [Macrobrachium rosenbergii]|uniref:protein SpAN-like isoform X2 n=1 Tax=Macrobrachium rosenbergii TaxID=79674 RepID=UPI0034D3C497
MALLSLSYLVVAVVLQPGEGGGDVVFQTEPGGTTIIGDMVLSLEQYENLFSSRPRKGVSDPQMMWQKEKGHPVVPYNISGDGEEFLKAVSGGMQHWENNTCVRFRHVTGNDRSFINFFVGDGCWSRIGRRLDNKPQDISLGRGCQFMGTAAHEIGHALGLLHEHMRTDRDSYIEIIEKNIQRGNEHNFYKETSKWYSNYDVKYDYTSLMHYTGEAFSRNGGLTIRSGDPLKQGMLGRNRVMSHRDRIIVNRMYGCLNMWLDDCALLQDPCQNEGYTGPNCECVCPTGTTGAKCETILHDYYFNRMSNCSMVIKKNDTTITTPNYPNFMQPDTWCVYEIKAPEGQMIKVTFDEFSLESYSTSQCSLGSLRLMENQDDSIADTLACGEHFEDGDDYRSKTNELIMYLDIWKNSKRSKGFKAHVAFLSTDETPRVIPNGIPDFGPSVLLLVATSLMCLMVKTISFL